ncbi:hypothetical protein HMN09_00470200 [Mycena chlorophos]|uniref:Zincin n=1 Tax=Mycena chlorophos TaxID=658473 RepID=A0A8H6WH09_MYCCL|nr:hypothetical protein HMN09_00470200 [Mycena chlorophos]
MRLGTRRSLSTALCTPAEISAPSLAPNLTAQLSSLPFDLGPSLPPARNTSLTQLSREEIPSRCLAFFNAPGSTSATTECVDTPEANGTLQLTAWDVTYEDCGALQPWRICHCGQAEMSLDTAIDRLARVPVGLRRFVGLVMVQPLNPLGDDPSDNTPRAYTELESGEIHFFGDAQVDTWVHESSHAFDFSTYSSPISNSSGWQSAIAADTCTTDTYAQSNRIEDFAQMTVTLVYALLHSNHTPPGLTVSCMQNQFDFVQGLAAYAPEMLFGNTCDLGDEDGEGNGARHTQEPATLDATRTFSTVPLDPSSTAIKTEERARNGGRGSQSRFSWALPVYSIGLLLLFVGS